MEDELKELLTDLQFRYDAAEKAYYKAMNMRYYNQRTQDINYAKKTAYKICIEGIQKVLQKEKV